MEVMVKRQLSIEYVPLSEVRPDPHNARKHPEANMDALKLSLKTYGQRKPLVVNSKTGIIEAGNGLWLAAKEMGWEEIAVVKVDDDAQTAMAYALMDNQSALLAEWEMPILKDILQELDTGAMDMDITGFSAEEIENLLTAVAPEESETCICGECGKKHKRAR